MITSEYFFGVIVPGQFVIFTTEQIAAGGNYNSLETEAGAAA